MRRGAPAWLSAALAFVLLACTPSDACPPADLAAINAKYVALGAVACKGVPFDQCQALAKLQADRLAEEQDAGCF